jgi:hypothetical protein
MKDEDLRAILKIRDCDRQTASVSIFEKRGKSASDENSGEEDTQHTANRNEKKPRVETLKHSAGDG